MKTLGDRVHEERRRLGMSQQEFDRHVGLTSGHTGMIEMRGRASERTIRKIARKLGLRVSYLAFGEGERAA